VWIDETETSYVELNAGQNSVQTLSLPRAELFASTGLVLENTWNSWDGRTQSKQSRVITETNLAVTFAATDSESATVWITDIVTNEPVANCKVTLYSTAYNYDYNGITPSDVRVISNSVITDAEGLATVTITGSTYNQLYAVVEDQNTNKLVVVTNFRLSSYPGSTSTAEIITDRAVYKPGDTVNVKLYVRAQAGTELAVPSTLYDFVENWSNGQEETITAVTLDKTTGAWSTSFKIPEDTKYATHQLVLRDRTNRYSYAPGRATITVSDPRPPTVLLALKPANDELIMSTTGPVDIQVATNTYAGTAVSGQTITVKWSGPVDELAGEFDVTTGADGTGLGAFALPEGAAELVSAGDTISFSASWVGPTREVVTADASILVSNSPWTVELAASPEDPLPGYEFGVAAVVKEMGSNAIQANVDVRVSLYNKGTSQTVQSANNDIAVGDRVGADACVMKSGAAVGCPTTLPTVGKFVLVACVTDPAGAALCAHVTAGKTEEEWAAAPLSSLAGISMAPDKQQYASGDTAKFSFYNPFANARALIMWGNQISEQHTLTELLGTGAQTFEVPIGDECIGGCGVTIIVSSPVQEAAIQLPANLATSLLFDPKLPQRIVSQHMLPIVGADREIEVDVQVDEAELTPGSEAGFTIRLTDANGDPVAGEVAVFVVDKAFLDLQPHPSVDLLESFELNLKPGSLQSQSNTDGMVGGAAYEASKDRIVDVATKDPWSTFASTGRRYNYNSEWAIKPGTHDGFDLSVDAYLAKGSTAFITDAAPSPGGGGYGGYGGHGGYGGYGG
jgi:uncharacterized protein YfaS (alpha-2-macroglobulin family)